MPTALFPDLRSEPISVQFDAPSANSEGGAAPLAAVQRQLCLTAAAVLVASRKPARPAHTLLEPVRQRVYLLALGYFDCNDSDRLRDDLLLRLLLRQDCDNGPGCASQPTLSRFESRSGSPGRATLWSLPPLSRMLTSVRTAVVPSVLLQRAVPLPKSFKYVPRFIELVWPPWFMGEHSVMHVHDGSAVPET